MGERRDWVCSCLVGFLFVLVLVNLEEANATSCSHIDIGVVTDQTSSVGRQQKIAIEMALQTFPFSNSFPKLELFHNDSNGNSAPAITSGNSTHLLMCNPSTLLFLFLTLSNLSLLYYFLKLLSNIFRN